ncbi:MAG: glycosyltransferase family 4 protein [Bacteroidota bacterium]
MPKQLENTRILMLHSTSDLYGASRIFLQTAGILKDEGAKVSVFLSEKGPLSEALEVIGIEVHILRLGILRRKYINPWGIINRIYFTLKAAFTLSSFIKKHSVELVYNNAASVFAGLIAANLTKTKHIWHIHEIILTPKPFASFLARLMAYNSSLNIYVSDATFKHWTGINQSIITKNRAVKIWNGIQIKEANPIAIGRKSAWNLPLNDNTIVIGMIGRINFWKGQLYFIEIANEILKSNKNVHFIMAGDPFPGYEFILDEIKSKIQFFNISDHITDLGFQKDTSEFFNTIDLLIVPSTLPDPLPTVVLEAMSYAKPVAGTQHGGIVEMIQDQITGIYIPVNDPKMAANKVLSILKQPILKAMGQKGLEYLNQEFSPERYKSLILSSIEKTLHDQL